MKKRWVAALLAALLLLLPAAARAESATTQAETAPAQGEPLESELPMEADAVSVLLLDARSGTVILEKNADEQRPAASLTKLMTILLTLEEMCIRDRPSPTRGKCSRWPPSSEIA